MRKNNKKYYYIGGLVLVLIILTFGILYYVNNSKSNFSFSEKSWINSNADNRIAVEVKSNLPIFSMNGQGVYYDYLTALEKDTGLSFTISVDSASNNQYVFDNKNELGKNDLVFYTDHYVLVSTNEDVVSNLEDIKSQVIGVVEEDREYVTQYLNQLGLNFKGYSDFKNLTKDMSDSIIYAIVPMHKYINEIINNKYNIVYHIEGLHSHYVLSMKDANSTMSSVFTKFFNKWEDEVYSAINKYFLDLYYTANKLSEMDKVDIVGDDLIVGYIENMPFEGKIGNTFSGVTDEYLSLFSDMTNATYKYIKYENVNKLQEALNNKKVDMVMNYYNISNSNYVSSSSLGNITYVIVTDQNNIIPVDSLESIKDDSIKMVGNTKLHKYIGSQSISIQVYSTYENLFKDLDNHDVVIMEKSTYDFYKNTKLKNHVIKYIGNTDVSNSFLLNKDNIVLNNMFNFYLTTLGSKTVNNMAVSNSIKDASMNIILQFIFSNLTYILALVAAVVFLLFKFNKKVKVTKKIKKEDKMMYLDVMTNLKNRNYLNDNLPYWEANKIYPQAIVVVDLNDISLINDAKGHEEGDRQIKSAASILIKTQRENSEIIRTDGNEFLVYLVGYDEKQVVTYVNKLYKELKELPYEYGASVGYSLLVSESTTIDDAINEALIMMRKNKGDKMKEKIKDFFKNLYEIMKKPEMLTLPSTLAYYFVLSVVPIITILLLIAGSFNLSISYVLEFFEKNFSQDLLNMITPMFTEQTFSLGFIIYILVAFFLSSNGSDSIIVASNLVFNIPNRHYVKRRVKACVMTLIIFLLFTFMLIVPVFGEQILFVLKSMGFNNKIVEAIQVMYPILKIPITLIVMFYFIKLIYIIAPDERVESKYVTKGAIFTTVCWLAVTFGYSYYIKHLAKYTVYYAGLSTIVVLMVWFYILAFVFVIGLGLNYRSVEEQIEKTNSIKLKELEEKVKANKEFK